MLWEKNPNEYRKTYIYGIKRESEAMRLGSKIHDATETDEESDDPIVEQGRLYLPRYPKMNYEIKVKCKACPLFGKLDTFDPETLKFREYKSGRGEWNTKKVQQHGQLLFYSYMIYLKYGKAPSEVWLDWINTDPESANYGSIKSFKFTLNTAELIKFHARIDRAWKGIIAMCTDNG